MFDVVPTYAAVLALMFLALSVRVIVARRRARIAFGTGGQPDVERRIRIHANFAEYVPFALILLLIADGRGVPAPALHALCALLLIGRLAHAVGLSTPRWDDVGRIAGMTGTQSAILGAAAAILLYP